MSKQITITVEGEMTPALQALIDHARSLDGTWVEQETTEREATTLTMDQVEEALPETTSTSG